MDEKSDHAKENVAHPEFANWSRFPVGTTVVRERHVNNAFGTVRVTTRMWLETKLPDKVIVGSQITVARPEQPVEENPEQLTTYPSEFELPAGLDPSIFTLPNPEAKLAGKESLEIDGRSIETDVYEWRENNEAGPMTVKVWHSAEVPGRIARQELLTLSSQTAVKEEIVSLAFGESK